MRKSLPIYLLFCGILSFFLQPSHAQDQKWIRYARGMGYEGNKAWAVENDADGNVYTAGYFTEGVILEDTTLESKGVGRLFITKHDSVGTLLWARVVGYSGGSHYYDEMDLKLDAAGNCYVVGSFPYEDSYHTIEGVDLRYNHFFIVKYAPSGTPLWVKGYGASTPRDYLPVTNKCQVNAMAIADDYIYLTGKFNIQLAMGNVTLTPAKTLNSDMFLCKLDLSGNVQFARQYGVNGPLEVGRDVAVTKGGDIYVTGDVFGILKYSNSGVLSQTLPLPGLRPKGLGVDEKDNVYHFSTISTEETVTIGGTVITTANRDKPLLVKFDRNLNLKWFSYATGGSMYNLSDAMETDRFGNTYIGGDASNLVFGNTTISEGLFMVKYDSSGVVKGTNNIMTSEGYGHDIAIGPQGRYYLVGGIGPSFFIAAYRDTLKNTSPGWVAARNLRTGEIGGTSVELFWTDTRDQEETEFIIERSIYPDRSFKYIASVPANAVTYLNNTGLRDDYTYYYRIRANGPQGYSKYSSVVKAKTPFVAPVKPGQLYAYKFSDTEVSISWGLNLRATEYEAEISENNTNNYISLGKSVSRNVKFSNAQLNALYHIRVRAFNAAGASEYAELVYTGHLLAPQAPDNLVATTSSATEIALTWRDNASAEQGFFIQHALSEAGPFSPVDTVVADVAAVTIGSLLPNTTYYFRVVAFNYTVLSVYTAVATAITAPAQPEQPSGPADVINTAGYTEYAVPAQAGLTYVWAIEPKEAGTITVLTDNAAGRKSEEECGCSKIRVTWNTGFTGVATISVQAVQGTIISERTEFDVTVRNAVITDVKEYDAAAAVSIFPNPTQGTVEIKVGPAGVNSGFEVIRPDGAVVLRGKLRDTSTKVELNGMAGLYLIRIQAKGGATYLKLILQ